MKRFLAIVLLGFTSFISAQTVQTTPNLITSGTTHTWTGVQTGAIPSNYMPGGPTPKYDPATNTFQFSYGSATVGQTIAINNALSGSGVQVNGYNYSYDARNMNGDDRQGNIDTFTVATRMSSNTNATLLSTSRTHNTKFDWTTFSGTQTAQTPYALSSLGNLEFRVNGIDSGYWGGYFGPQIRNVNMSLNYTVDPCVTNPAYSVNCANYSTVNISNNLVPNPTAYATGGSSIDQSYAINQALGLSGANVMIHGFQWGYTANANGPYCAFSILICLDNRTPSVSTNVNIADNNGNSIYSVNRTYTNSYNTTDYKYLFPSSRNLATLGRFNLTATTVDQGYVGDVWSKALYTPDPCTVNPLSSTSCPGYQQAYHDQQCTANPLYASDCPGYTAAYLTQQCSANALYSQSCPNYATAYHNQQCSINPLYATDCTGYATAYHDQQCSLNALYATDCTGYQQAYLTQQCNISPLYSTQCTGYATAYHDQQCSLNALYMSDCTGYQAAYLTQQCNISQLYSTSCPGYQQAYFAQQCQLNGLYDRTCPNYAAAYAAKNILATPAVTATPTVTAVTTTSTATVSSNPAATAISDPVVSNAVSTPSTTSATSPTSVTSVITTTAPVATSANPVAAATTAATNPAPVAVTPAAAQAQAVEAKKTDNAVASVEKKSGGNREDAKKAATERAKELANEAGKAATLEQQAATQSLVVGLMGYVPGFNAYQNSIVPDVNVAKMARQYNKPVIDNRNAQRRLSGANEAKWQEMVDSQYSIGK